MSFSKKRRRWVVVGVGIGSLALSALAGWGLFQAWKEKQERKALTQWVKLQPKGLEEALPEARTLLEQYPQTRTAYEVALHLSFLAFEAGRWEEAEEFLKEAERRVPSSRVAERVSLQARRGLLKENLHQWKEARAFLEGAILDSFRFEKRGLPQAPALRAEWRLALGRCAELEGDREAALKFYGQVLQESPQSSFAERARLALDRLGGGSSL